MHFFVSRLFSCLTTICWTTPMPILLTKGPIHDIFAKKYWELVELDFFLVGHFDLVFSKKKLGFGFFFLGFHMRCHIFLHYGWFLQNFGKDFIRTNMLTTLHTNMQATEMLMPSNTDRCIGGDPRSSLVKVIMCVHTFFWKYVFPRVIKNHIETYLCYFLIK